MFSIHSISFGLKDASTHYQCALEYERAARKWTVLEIDNPSKYAAAPALGLWGLAVRHICIAALRLSGLSRSEIEEITLSSKSDFILPHIVVAEIPIETARPHLDDITLFFSWVNRGDFHPIDSPTTLDHIAHHERFYDAVKGYIEETNQGNKMT